MEPRIKGSGLAEVRRGVTGKVHRPQVRRVRVHRSGSVCHWRSQQLGVATTATFWVVLGDCPAQEPRTDLREVHLPRDVGG